MSIDQQKDQLDKWADMWDKALEKGIFDDGPGPPIPSPHTSDDSFFGLKNTNPTAEIKDADSEYWAGLHNTPELGGHGERLLQEQKKKDVREATDIASSWTDPKTSKKYPANPLPTDTGGKDQALEPAQLGVTFDEKDIEKLIDIKNQLHELENKIIVASVGGKSTKSVETQIENLKKKLDKLSSSLSHSIPNDVSAN